MAVTASSTSNGPRFRYAPEDPTLPKPWKGLVDRSTGYLYFWNTETNVTQYERPAASPLLDPIPSPELKSASSPINSSAQIHQSSGSSLQEQQKNDSSREYSRDNGGDDNGPRQAAASAVQKHPDTGGSISCSQNVQSSASAGYGGQTMKPPAAVPVGGGSSFESYRRQHEITVICLYGGAPKGPQLKDLARGTDIVVATPGRLNDILEMKRVSLHQVSYLVLDEADRMLDMGFEPQIRKIVKEIPTRRQTLMYTATWPKEVRKIAADLLVNPVQVNIGNIDQLVANKSITQYVEVMTSMEKHRRLEQILRSQEPGSKIIVFCSTKKMCDQLARNINRQFGAASIHGDKSQSERDMVLNEFRTGKSPILVATDVAARGLDIKDIRVVVNYDFPTGVEDYVHRIGRTGRAGATGLAYTFFGDHDAKYALDLIKVLEGASQQVPPELREMVGRGGGMGRTRRWGSEPSGSSVQEGSRSYGGGPEDSDNDGSSAWGSLSSGWSAKAHSDQGHDGPEPCKRSHIDNPGLDSGCGFGANSRNRSRSPPSRQGMFTRDEGGAW